ncbi:MAG: hypothetical protein ABSF90_17170 [Syntrophobacteraceae bacterium]|jgi:hypothetical protein
MPVKENQVSRTVLGAHACAVITLSNDELRVIKAWPAVLAMVKPTGTSRFFGKNNWFC